MKRAWESQFWGYWHVRDFMDVGMSAKLKRFVGKWWINNFWTAWRNVLRLFPLLHVFSPLSKLPYNFNPKNWQTYLLFYTLSISGILGLSNAIFAREGARDPLSRKGAIYPVDFIVADTVARIFICSEQLLSRYEASNMYSITNPAFWSGDVLVTL